MNPEEAVDLSSLGTSDFAPYIFDRNEWWVLLPLISLLFVFLHLKKIKRKPGGSMHSTLKSFIILTILLSVERAVATEFEKLGDAIAKALGTTKVFKTSVKNKSETIDVFYSKNASGTADKMAVIQKRIYEPNCTHTWVIRLDAVNAEVGEVRVVEMSCPHAFPTRQASYLDQYKGKGPKDAAQLSTQIHTIAKATGSSQLTTDAVVTAIKAVHVLKGKF